jgi:hypothetical protein
MQEPASPIHVAHVTIFMRDSSASAVIPTTPASRAYSSGMVQPFGFLIAVSVTDWLGGRVSQNISQWMNATDRTICWESDP